MSVVIETTIGDITVDLYVKERPNACLNFLKLCKVKFYNLCVFYKIEKNFIAQTGDPTATGRGGESIFCRLYGDQAKYFDAEFKPRLKHEKVGTLSMVNNGNNMNGSQFFITLSANLTYLDENHSVFGEVAEGFDVLLKLNDAICDNNNRPYQDIRITHTVILHDPFEDPKGLPIPDASPKPTKEMLESDYIGADEEIDDTKGKTAEEIEEKIKESEAKARATILEMVGDIPDAEVKPPENVLFVCKLNPVTTSEDLEVIFSRFGKILSCEVIKDKKTEESLQYAFIEFEREEDCEAAFFKMDNVLIDDRRIHVDFSQSVSKLYFNRNNASSKKQSKSNLMLKNSGKNDGYDLIFDDESDDAINSTRHKSKSSESTSKHKNSSEKRKHSPSRDDYEERRKMRVEREEHSHSYKPKDDKNYKYNSEKERYRYSEKQREDRKNYSYESEKSTSRRSKEDNYSRHYDKSRDLKQGRCEKYEKKSDKKYEDDSYSSKRSSDYKSKNRHSLDDLSKTYQDSKNYGKSSNDFHTQEHRVSHKRIKEKSVSPDLLEKSYKSKEHYSDTSHKKHSNRSDSEEHIKYNKSGRFKNKNAAKETVKSASHKQKKDKIKKHHHSKKQKSKTSRSVSVSSSASSTSSSSSSSSSTTTSSNSISDPSTFSNHSKHHKKNPVKDRKYHDSLKKTKSKKKKH